MTVVSYRCCVKVFVFWRHQLHRMFFYHSARAVKMCWLGDRPAVLQSENLGRREEETVVCLWGIKLSRFGNSLVSVDVSWPDLSICRCQLTRALYPSVSADQSFVPVSVSWPNLCTCQCQLTRALYLSVSADLSFVPVSVSEQSFVSAVSADQCFVPVSVSWPMLCNCQC